MTQYKCEKHGIHYGACASCLKERDLRRDEEYKEGLRNQIVVLQDELKPETELIAKWMRKYNEASLNLQYAEAEIRELRGIIDDVTHSQFCFDKKCGQIHTPSTCKCCNCMVETLLAKIEELDAHDKDP